MSKFLYFTGINGLKLSIDLNDIEFVEEAKEAEKTVVLMAIKNGGGRCVRVAEDIVTVTERIEKAKNAPPVATL